MLRTCSEPDLLKAFELEEELKNQESNFKKSNDKKASPRLGNTKKSNDSAMSTVRLAKSLEDLSKVNEEKNIELDEEVEVI